MTPKLYECGMLANVSFRAAISDNVDEILCVACTFRNRVMRYGKTYSQVLEEAELRRPWPAVNHPALVDPTSGVLAAVEDIYDNKTPDLTSNHLHKNGALWFCRPQDHQGTGDFYEKNILTKAEEHVLIGQWGMLHFYE